MSEDAGKIDHVLVQVTVPARIEDVWRALRDPVEINRWFGWDAESLADEIDYIFVKGARPDDANHVLYFDGIDDRFELKAEGDATVLTVIRAAPAGDWDDVYSEMIEGWIAFVQQLRLALGRHRGEERRTLYLSGAAVSADVPPPSRALGLRDLTAGPDGASYEIQAAGETLRGELWHRSAHQTGVSVEGWGEGMLIANDQPASDKRPNGGGWVTLTTYGLGESAFDDLRRRWTEWWSSRYEPVADPSCEEPPQA